MCSEECSEDGCAEIGSLSSETAVEGLVVVGMEIVEVVGSGSLETVVLCKGEDTEGTDFWVSSSSVHPTAHTCSSVGIRVSFATNVPLGSNTGDRDRLAM